MRHAEDVIFGGSALDRAAEIRGNRAILAELKSDPDTRCIVFWRGKPLFSSDVTDALARVAMDHPVLADAAEPILLGRENGKALFAADISAWEPDDLDATAMQVFADPTRQQHPALPKAVFVELRLAMTLISARDAELAATAKAVFGWHRTHRFCARCGAESKITMAGWQRDCDSCGAHHFPRTDPVVIMLVTRGNSTLLGRSPHWPEGMYSCLAGFVEPGETIEAAVRRETMEEAGVAVGRVRYLASQPWPFPASLMLGCQGEALSRDITLDPNELEDACWVTREELADAMAGKSDWLKPAREGAIAHFLLRNWLADRLD